MLPDSKCFSVARNYYFAALHTFAMVTLGCGMLNWAYNYNWLVVLLNITIYKSNNIPEHGAGMGK